MADRRMFAKSIVLSDTFLDMPMSARCLYFTLGMLADDDGFVGSPKAIMRQCGASEDDLKVLLSKRYLLSFESGIIVIKHWRMNNYLRNDRYKPTTYLEELSTLELDSKNSYIEKNPMLGIPNGYQMDTDGIPMVSKVDTQVRLGKDSIDKIISNDIICQKHSANDFRPIIEKWNSLSKFGISSVQKMASSSTRYKMLVARVNEYSVDDILKAIDMIAESDFLKGRNKDGWVITFDWFVKPNNFPKVLEGNYVNRNNSSNNNQNHTNYGFKSFGEREREYRQQQQDEFAEYIYDQINATKVQK